MLITYLLDILKNLCYLSVYISQGTALYPIFKKGPLNYKMQTEITTVNNIRHWMLTQLSLHQEVEMSIYWTNNTNSLFLLCAIWLELIQYVDFHVFIKDTTKEDMVIICF